MFEKLVKRASSIPFMKTMIGPSASVDAGWISSLFGGSDRIPKEESYEDYVDLYKDLVWVYACVFAIATSASTVPAILSRKEIGSKKAEVISEHPFIKLIEGPVNEMQSWVDLLEGTLTYLELVGDAYWEIVRDNSGNPRELYLMRPDRVAIVPTADNKHIEHYIYCLNFKDAAEKKIVMPKADVLHFSYFSPLNDWYGFGSAYAAESTAELDLYAIDYSKNYMKNYGVPDGYLKTDQPISREEIKRMGSAWSNRSRGKTPVLPKGLDWVKITNTPQELSFADLRRYDRDEILAAFKVPPIIVGLVEDVKYNTYQIQERHFYEKTIGPKLEKIAFQINSFLLPHYTDNLTLSFDIQSQLTGSHAALVDSLYKEFLMGGVTPNQIRAILGRGGPYPNGGSYYTSKNIEQIGDDSGKELTFEEPSDGTE